MDWAKHARAAFEAACAGGMLQNPLLHLVAAFLASLDMEALLQAC